MLSELDKSIVVNTFKGREDICAHDFRPMDKEITIEDYRTLHLTGDTCVGFYVLRKDNTVHCSCVDFDDHDDDPNPEWREDAQKVFNFLESEGYTPTAEVSSSGSGAHIWLFFEDPIPAWLIRKFWTGVSKKVDQKFKEIYPRQDKLSGKGLGNLVRLPYWNKSRFVDVNESWEELDRFTPTWTYRSEIEASCIRFGTSLVPPVKDEYGLPGEISSMIKNQDSRLYKKWHRMFNDSFDGDRSTSASVFYIACELVYQRVHTDVIKSTLRHWCEKEGYDKGDNDVWLSTVINNAYDSVRNRLSSESEQSSETVVDCANVFLKSVGANHYFGSGIAAVDYSIDGVGPGEVAIIAARPGHGKSALALQWLIYQAQNNINCLMLNAEMSAREIGRRVVMNGFPEDEAYWEENKNEIMEKIEEYWKDKGKLFYRPVGSIEDVETNIKSYVENKGVQLVAIDYLQLLRSSTSSGRYETVTEISQRIKGCARDYNIGILALCQVSREVEKRDNVEFQGSDLRESGQLEQDADLILFGWNYGKDNNSDNPRRYDVHVAKRRNGPVKKQKLHLRFESSEQRFY